MENSERIAFRITYKHIIKKGHALRGESEVRYENT